MTEHEQAILWLGFGIGVALGFFAGYALFGSTSYARGYKAGLDYARKALGWID